jgi:hypothetical protein
MKNLYQKYKTQDEYQRLMNNQAPKSKREWVISEIIATFAADTLLFSAWID